jgi:hypothetical protein
MSGLGVALILGSRIRQPSFVWAVAISAALIMFRSRVTRTERSAWVLIGLGWLLATGAASLSLDGIASAAWLSGGLSTVGYAITRRSELAGQDHTEAKATRIWLVVVVGVVVAAVLFLTPLLLGTAS